MPIGNITQTISTIPPAGARGVDVQTIFVTKQEDFQDHLQGTTVVELNALVTQQNTMAEEMNSTATQINTNANTATTKAGEANTSASSASTSASEALTSRNQAETFKNQAETFAQQAKASAESVDVNNLVHRTGAETIAGVKTFSSSPIVPTPTTSTQVANKAYADTKQTNLGFTPVQQGTGVGQLSINTVKIGWSGNRTKITIDSTDMGNIVMDSDIGVANSSLVKTALNASGTAPIYACRAWVNFNGTGTVAIRASGNVSSITDNGVGNYTVNFTTAMQDANYSVAALCNKAGAIDDFDASHGNIPKTTSTTILTYVGTVGYGDALYVHCQIFR